jgi:perosamine synthetase
VRLDASIDRDGVMAALQARGVACKPYLPAVHLQPFYRSLGHRPGECPVAEAVARSTLALPFHTRLAADDQAYVAACLADVLD